MSTQDFLAEYNKKKIDKANNADVCYDKVQTSKFSFYLKLITILVFFVAYSCVLVRHSFKKSTPKINESSLYKPKYK